MTEIPYMMVNTRAEFERVRDLAWPVTDRTAATDAEFRSRIAAFEAAPTPPEVVEVEQLADVIARFHDMAEPSPWMYDLAAAVAAAAVAGYRATQDGGAEEAVRRVEALAAEYERTPPGTVTRDRDVALDLRAALAPQADR